MEIETATNSPLHFLLKAHLLPAVHPLGAESKGNARLTATYLYQRFSSHKRERGKEKEKITIIIISLRAVEKAVLSIMNLSGNKVR